MSKDSDKLRLALTTMRPSRKALLANYAGDKKPDLDDVAAVSKFVKALADTVESRRRTELRGLGVFEWLPCRGKTPTGEDYESWRMVFRFNQKRRFSGGGEE